MKTTVTTTEAQANLPRLLRQLPAKKSLTITSHGRIAGFLISKDRMEAIIETMEVLANPKAMKGPPRVRGGPLPGQGHFLPR